MQIKAIRGVKDILPGEVEKWQFIERLAREVFEREYLMAQVTRFGGNISRTANFIGMERSALHRKLKSLGVHGTDERPPSSS